VESTPLAVGSMRLLIGGSALLIFVLISKGITYKNLPKKRLLLASLSMALYQPLFFTGVDLTGVAVGTVVTICSAPIFAGLIEWMIHRRVPDWVWLVSTLLAVIGCFLLFQS